MRKLPLYLALLLMSCSQLTIDENTAKAKVGELIMLLKDHKYDKTKEYYSDSFNESEPVEARAKKFEQIEAASGPIISSEVIESSKQQLDERTVVALKYKVVCKNTTLIESFVVALEEGNYKVLKHDITNKP